jgi:hypothetical protein
MAKQEDEELDFETNNIGYQVFIKVFDGNITKWKSYLKKRGSMDQVKDDYQFVLRLEKKLKEDPGFLERIENMVKKRGGLFSPEFEKVLEAINNWKTVNSKGKSFIASFAEHDDKGNPIGDTMILGFGFKDICKIHLELFEKALNEEEAEDDFINW